MIKIWEVPVAEERREVAAPAANGIEASFAPDTSSYRLYMNEIGQIPLLSPQKELELARQAKAGDAVAGNQLIEANLRLVVVNARKYVGRGLSLVDMVSEGNIGMMHALTKFDPERGFRFSTYATWWIKQGIRRAIYEQGSAIRLPVYIAEAIIRIEGVGWQLLQELGREATDEEIAAAAHVTVKKVVELRDVGLPVFSLEMDANDHDDHGHIFGNAASFANTIADPSAEMPDETSTEQIQKEELKREVALHLAMLPERQRRVLELRHGIDGGNSRTLPEVGKVLGLTSERIRQIEVDAMANIRRPSILEALRYYT